MFCFEGGISVLQVRKKLFVFQGGEFSILN